ncbi:BGTF surface domain-containing protein [Halorussus salinisoli]|uniref:BGTF surface domain-containing protein n=1 Tax=Halorussus salinisoli TaxID=2558242 RepID=UPI0010C16C56|nr:BGTF surface domain-containing protein [Halorussus salinisoli]
MSARPPQYRVVTVVVVLLAASVVPAVGPGAGVTTAPLARAGTAADGSFTPSVVYEERGDVMNITVTTPKAGTLNIGSPEENFWLQANVGKGTTKLRLNTFKAGREGYGLGEMVSATEGSISNLELQTERIDAPLEPAKYPMNVTANGQEQAIGAFVIEDRATNDMDARIAPGSTGISELDSPAGIADATVPPWNNGSVAAEDWFVVHVNATGLSGMVTRERLGPGDDGVHLKFTQSDSGMNANAHQFWGDEVERFVRDGAGDGFYAFVDTGEHGIEPGSTYNVTFTVTPESELTDRKETVSTRMRVVPRRLHVNRNGPGEAVVVEGRTEINGTTSFTPGTTINISARDDDLPPILLSETVTVEDDRTFATTFDFSDLEPGRKFEFRLPDQEATVAGMVAPEETTTTPNQTTTTPNKTTATKTTTAKTTTTTATTTTVATTTAGLTQAPLDGTAKPLTQQASKNGSGDDDESGGNSGLVPVPGFDGVAGVAAVLAAALLAARRR